MTTHTVHLHRVVRCPPERVYRAFVEPAALCRWLPPDGYTAALERMDVRIGGHYRMSFKCFSTGHGHAFGGEYLELVPAQRIRYTAVFDDPNLSGTMQTLVMLRAVDSGTDLDITQEGIPAIIPPDACYLGWQQSIASLIRLVEPDGAG